MVRRRYGKEGGNRHETIKKGKDFREAGKLKIQKGEPTLAKKRRN